MTNRTILEVNDISKNFDGYKVIDHISFNVSAGDNIGIIGPNGAGKSTLFNILHGMLELDSGTISYNGNRIDRVPCHLRARMGIGRLFQHIRIFREMTVLENMFLGAITPPLETLRAALFQRNLIKNHERQQLEIVKNHLETVGLEEKIDDPAKSLSIGQQRLLAIARLLMANSNILLLDEPIAGVSPVMADKINLVIKNLESIGKTVIVIEHDLTWIFELCQEIIVMDQGRIVYRGTPKELVSGDLLRDVFIEGSVKNA
jgi:ABC-type branched-subunit amino acid transport system ATPase component